MKCPNCGEELAPGMAFCGMCGTQVPTTKKCIKCGAELPLAMKFCGMCGTNQEAPAGGGNGGGGVGVGLSMGDKNVVAGDVIGSKDETHISGNATIIKNEDESKKVARCHICGSNVLRLDGYDCPDCGQFTCPDCFDRQKGVCVKCRDNQAVHAEENYKAAVIECLQNDSRIDAEEFQKLRALQQQLGLSDFRAMELQEEVKNKARRVVELSTFEKLNYEKAINLFYDDGLDENALNAISPIYQAHQDDDGICELYYAILQRTDKDKLKGILDSKHIDEPSVYKSRISLAFEETRFDEAERIINMAERLWPDDYIIKCYKVMFNVALAKEFKNNDFLNTANDMFLSLREPATKLEKSWNSKLEHMIGKEKGMTMAPRNAEFCKSHGLYAAFMSRNPIKSSKSSEPVVGPGCDFPTIQEALDYVDEKAVIHVKPGIYKEQLSFNKKVTLVGCDGPIGDMASSALPIIVTDPDSFTLIDKDVSISGIVFTNNKDISFSNLDEYAKRDVELEKPEDSGFPGDDGFKSILDVGHATLKNVAVLDGEHYGVCFTSDGSLMEDSYVAACRDDNLLFSYRTTAVVKNTKISLCRYPAVYLMKKANPILESCEICYNLQKGVQVTNEAAGSFIGCIISNNNNVGVVAQDETSTEFSACKIFGNEANGVAVDGDSTVTFNTCAIYDNIEEGSAYPGVVIKENAKPTLKNCTISGHTSNGIWIKGESQPVITKCTVKNNSSEAIDVEENAGGKISECDIFANTDNGLMIQGDSAPEITDCKIHDNTKEGGNFPGVFIRGTSKPVLSGCTINGNCTYGILIKGEGQPVITKCKIHSNGNEGINVKEKGGGKISGCEIFGNFCNGLVVEEEAAPTVTDCNIHDNKKEGSSYPGVLVRGTAKPVISSCTISGHSSYGLWLKGEEAGSYKNLKITKNADAGIKAAEKAHGVIENSEVFGNTMNGAIFDNDCTVTLRGCKLHDNKTQGKNFPGVVSKGKARPVVENCEIYGHTSNGIWVKEEAIGTYKNCDVHNNGDKAFCNDSKWKVDFSTCKDRNNG